MYNKFDFTTPSAFDGRKHLIEETSRRVVTESLVGDPTPDLTIEVAYRLAKDEHPRLVWGKVDAQKQMYYVSCAQFIITNIRRFDRENHLALKIPNELVKEIMK